MARRKILADLKNLMMLLRKEKKLKKYILENLADLIVLLITINYHHLI
jgi:hypothetical protein